MKKVAPILVAAGALLAVVLVIGPRILRDPEVSNPYELDAGPIVEAALPPDLFSSDPGLFTPSANLVRERIVEEGTDAGMEGAPYVIELADGRYVFGHSDRAGHTRAIYTREPIPHRVYWYDDALARWHALHAASRDAVRPPSAADGAASRR